MQFFPIALTQTCPDDLANVQGSAGEWHGVLELVVLILIDRGSIQDVTRYVRLKFPKNVMDPGVVGSGDAE